MTDILVIGVVAVVFVAALRYIHKEKKRGIQCVGCPDAPRCSGNCAGCSGGCPHQK